MLYCGVVRAALDGKYHSHSNESDKLWHGNKRTSVRLPRPPMLPSRSWEKRKKKKKRKRAPPFVNLTRVRRERYLVNSGGGWHRARPAWRLKPKHVRQHKTTKGR